MDGVIRKSIGAEGPVGFVFEGDSKGQGERVSAVELFAAAGAPVIVLDEVEDVQVRRRRRRGRRRERFASAAGRCASLSAFTCFYIALCLEKYSVSS